MPAWGFVALVEDWPQVIEQIAKSEPALRRLGRDDAADLLLVAYREFRNDLTRLGSSTAIAGTVKLREIEKATRVRDRGGIGPNHLGHALHVRDLGPRYGGLLPGAVGIADLHTLDLEVPWWETNERGSSARVGGRIFGTFSGPGAGPPDSGSFREHALFRTNIEPGISGPGIIKRPIPARHFIEIAAAAINADWRSEFHEIRSRFESRLDEVARVRR